MTRSLIITKDVAETIVEMGSNPKPVRNTQSLKTSETTPHAGHLSGRILSMISDSSDDYTDDGIDNSSNQYLVTSGSDTFHVFCPLTSDTIPNNTGVMFQRNMSNGHWEIFATECY